VPGGLVSCHSHLKILGKNQRGERSRKGLRKMQKREATEPKSRGKPEYRNCAVRWNAEGKSKVNQKKTTGRDIRQKRKR